MSPAELVIQRFNGSAILSRLLGVEQSTVAQWKIRNGRIPTNKQRKLLKLAKKMGIPLTSEEVIFGTDAA